MGMGEVVVSSDEDVILELKEVEARKSKEEEGEDGTTSSVIKWERFLPRMVLRVLLVEADDSTRQIIAALLRKCSYRVAAVPDGLKAWEVLKGKPYNIDLILTEVDLPSISGFALLSLIMEHDICKNIPVIMMSSNDSVSTVYKCMLRGAADFLVKPMRKNELRNLWQHVWRRQASTMEGHGPQDESVAQQKVEATAENDASSNHSSGHMSCIRRNRECVEKGSDAQSCCTKPDLEAEGACTENMQDPSQLKWSKSPVTDMNGQQQKVCAKSSIKLPMRDCEGLVVPVCEDDNAIEREDVARECQRKHANIIDEVWDNNRDLVNCSTEAIDLIGTFDNCPKYSYRSPFDTNNVDSSPLLDLYLWRSHPNGSVDQFRDRRLTLNHSDASAFSRYENRALHPLQSSASICNQQKEYERQFSSHNVDYNSNANGLTLSSQNNMLSLATGQSRRAEVSQNNMLPQKTPFPVPVPVKSIRFDGLCSADGSVVPTIFCTESGFSTVQSPGSAHNQGPPFQLSALDPSNIEASNSQQFHNMVDHNANNFTNQTELKQRHKLESSEDRRYFFSATDQSTSSSLGNGTANHLNSIGCVRNGNVDQVAVAQTATESRNEVSLPIGDSNCHRTVQREAALTKFRLKRKDRCYAKKVRYESRKKLAEQRPRVKGQFVRQVHTESAPIQTGRRSGNSLYD